MMKHFSKSFQHLLYFGASQPLLFILMKANTADFKIVAILQKDNQKKCPSKGN